MRASYELWDAAHRYGWLRQVEDCKGQSYHNVCDSNLITHHSKLKSRKRESFTEFWFRIALSPVFITGFAFVFKMRRSLPIS